MGAGVSYGVQSVLVSVATQNGITPFLLLFIRSSFQSCAFFIMLKFNILTTNSTKPASKNENSKSIPDSNSLLPPIEHLPYILTIVTCYFFATASSFVSFSLIPPGAGIGTRGAARALAALGLTYLFLQEDLSYSKVKKYDNWKNKLLHNKFIDVFIGAICLTGIGLVVKSIPAQLCSLTSEEYGIELNDVKTVGYLLAVFAGLSRAVGMCLYRNKRDIGSFNNCYKKGRKKKEFFGKFMLILVFSLNFETLFLHTLPAKSCLLARNSNHLRFRDLPLRDPSRKSGHRLHDQQHSWTLSECVSERQRRLQISPSQFDVDRKSRFDQ